MKKKPRRSVWRTYMACTVTYNKDWPANENEVCDVEAG